MNKNNELNALKKVDKKLNESGFDPQNTYTKLKQSLKSFLSSKDDKDKQKILKEIKELKDNENKIIDNAISE